MELTIPWTPVKALLHLAGKDDIREQVNGVWIDQRGPRVIVWATAGFTLGAFQTEEPSTNVPDVFLPRHIVEACRGFAVQATVKREDDGRMSISCMGTTHYWQCKNPVTLDWRRVIPSGDFDGIARQFDVTLVAAFEKVRKALGGDAVRIAHRTAPKASADGLLVSFFGNPEFIGVLMPIRDDHATVAGMRKAAPDWVREVGRLPVEETDLA
jgi:hypothetical protein